MTIEQLLHSLQEDSRFRAQRNERLLQEYERLETCNEQKKNVVSYQQYLIYLGGKHVRLLESVIQWQSTGTITTTESSSPPPPSPEFAERQFQQQTCSSPLSTPPSLRLESNQVTDSRSPRVDVPEDEFRRGDITYDYSEAIQQDREAEAVACLPSYY